VRGGAIDHSSLSSPAATADAQHVAEGTRAWAASDPGAAEAPAANDAAAFGSGAVIGSLCAKR
jgi:hypothetical protein